MPKHFEEEVNLRFNTGNCLCIYIKAKVSVTGIKFTSIRNHCFPLILSNVSGVILSDESHEIVDNGYYSTADL